MAATAAGLSRCWHAADRACSAWLRLVLRRCWPASASSSPMATRCVLLYLPAYLALYCKSKPRTCFLACKTRTAPHRTTSRHTASHLTLHHTSTSHPQVNGIAVVVRARGDRIELWSRTASNEAAQVGRKINRKDTMKDLRPLIGFAVRRSATRRPGHAKQPARDACAQRPTAACLGH